MLTVNNISKSFGIQPVLKDISFTVNAGERLGLIGPNGCGKTTLLRILVGEEGPDRGVASFNPKHLRIGYLPQGMAPQPDETIQGFLARMHGDENVLSTRLEDLAARLAQQPDQPALQAAFDKTIADLATASENKGRAQATLAALGLGDLPLDTPAAHLSGGQKTRLSMAGVLLSDPSLLLLDEPTNHLDLDMLVWLEDWLLSFRGGALIVSHDRAFLDRSTTGILELDPQTHTMKAYPGNYSEYLEQKIAERERQWQAYSDQQEQIARLRYAASRLREQARFHRAGKGDSGDKFAKGFFGNRSTKGTIGRARNLEQRLERLLNEDKLDKPKSSWQMKLDFGASPPSGKDVLRLEGLAIGYNSSILLKDLNAQVRLGERIALVGPNGSGKTTLLRTIAGQIPPLQGRVFLGANVRLGYMTQEQEDLNPTLDVLSTIRRQAPLTETEARTFLHLFLFSGDDVFLPVNNLSYGERARLSLAGLVARGCNLLLLDEPINHLDIPSRARFERALSAFEGTVLAVIHDRYFIEGFATLLWKIDRDSFQVFPESF